MEDSKTLFDYGVVPDSTITLLEVKEDPANAFPSWDVGKSLFFYSPWRDFFSPCRFLKWTPNFGPLFFKNTHANLL
jgi:hypothetical protein